MRKRIIISLVALVFVGGIFVYIQSTEQDEAGKVVGKYTGDQTSGFEDILNSSENFKLGANKYGQPIFVNKNKAFAQLKETCEAGIKAVKEKGNLPGFKKNDGVMGAYASIGAELSENEYDEDIVKQAAFLGIFYDFYSHSDDDFYD